jgi:putative peptidoglycan lipid II flippase
MALARFAATIGGYTLLSRILGFVRDILIAAVLGTGPFADAFFVAFKLPNFFRRLFAEGAFSAGFVPIFSSVLRRQGRVQALGFAEEALSLMLIGLLLLVIAFQIAMPWLVYLLAPGFGDRPGMIPLTVEVTRLTFPYLLFVSLVSLLGGVLNSLERFAAAAAAPILLNVTLILALAGFAELLRTPAHVLGWAVSIAGIAQLIWMLAACRRAGIRLRLIRPRLTARLKRLLLLMLPAALGAGVVQINLVIDVVLASFLKPGSVSYLFYADRLYQLPLGVVGVAIGTALLPTISRQLAAGESAEANNSLNRAVELALLLTLPAAAALLVIPGDTVATLFERGAYTALSSERTAWALAAYALGLPAYVLVKALTPAYFGRLDTRTPVLIAAVCVAVNLGLNLVLMQFLAHVGLALATALSSWLNVALLTVVLRRRGHFRFDPRLSERLRKGGVATLLMAAAVGALDWALAGLFAGSQLERAAGLTLLVLTGLVVYGLVAVALKALDPREFASALKRGRGGG